MKLGWVLETFPVNDDGSTTRFELRCGWFFQWWCPWFELVLFNRFWLVGWVPKYKHLKRRNRQPHD